ncbi:enoyl-CoA hydratase/isomerase family protein [Photobacterium damselae]|uniref:enoyl-CoA hydratase/isomerase family protein n=1 Tax=Photobacterium damselae TaxID=38293 RepID=UPI003C6E6C28
MDIQLSIDNGIAQLTLDRPQTYNALTLNMYQELGRHFIELTNNPEVKIIILTSSSDFFCSGNDMFDFQTIGHCSEQEIQKHRLDIESFMFNFINCSKPIIAAVTGPAIGIGTTLLQYCDYVVASSHSYFQTPFTALGLCPEFGASVVLEKLIGARKARAMLLFSEKMTASEASELRFINAISAKPIKHSYEIAGQLQHLSINAIAHSKRMLKNIQYHNLEETIKQENDLIFQLIQQLDAQARIEKFIEKSRR